MTQTFPFSPKKGRRRLSSAAAIGGAVLLGGFSQTERAQITEPLHSEDAFKAFDLATTGDVRDVMRAAQSGDIAAQYAVSIIALHGLQGRQVNLEVSARFLSMANREGPFETETVTRITPGENGSPAQMRIVDRQVNVHVRAFSDAYGECVGEVLGTRPNPEACGDAPQDRDRRKAAWRSASAVHR